VPALDLTAVPAEQLSLVYQIAWPTVGPAPIVASGGYVCAGIGELTVSGVPVGAAVRLDGKEWALAASYARAPRDCDDLGVAGFPIPFVDGYVFLAAPSTLGRTAMDRGREAWHIYRQGPAGAVATGGRGYHHPRGMARAGSCAVVVSAVRDGKNGLYLDNLQGSSPKRVAAGAFDQVAVANDSHAAAVVQRTADGNMLTLVRLPGKSTAGCNKPFVGVR
jgi:hypothetical protein